MKKTRKRICSLLLSLCMVFTMLATVAFADEGASTTQITGFDALADDVDFQEVKFGTTKDGLNLPSTLTATTTDSTYTATVSDWVSDPTYDGNTPGNYTLTPTLNLPSDVKLADGVTPPTITVNVLEFFPVTSITDVITTMAVGESVALSGTVVPAKATNQDILWSIYDAGTTGATIKDGTLSATAAGTVVVTATITDGIATGTDYTQDFTISVKVLTVDPSTYTFDPLEVGYGTSEFFYLEDAQTKTFTVTNTGDTELTGLSLSNSYDEMWFNLSGSTPFSPAPKESVEFTVEPIDGLSSGTYTATVYVNSSGNVLASVPLSLTVTKRVPRLKFGTTDVHKVDTDFSGTGYSWNATTKTLTLTPDYAAGRIQFMDCDSDMATLKLDGDVTIDETASTSSCLVSTCDMLTIDLDGHTLTLITGGNDSEALYGYTTTIQNGTLVARLQGSGTEEDTESINANQLTVEKATVIADADSPNYGGTRVSMLKLNQGAKVYTCGAVGLKFTTGDSLNLASDDISITSIGSTYAVYLDADLDYTSGSALKCWTNTDTTQPSPVGEGTLLSSKTLEALEYLWGTSKYVYISTQSPKSIVTVINGTGSGEYSQNTSVAITANTAPIGKQFKEWTVVSGGVTLGNTKAPTTTFTMPANAVAVTATYEDIPAGGTDITDKFTDANFRAAVYDKISKTAPEAISVTDVSGITSLNVKHKSIKSLAGIEYFTALTMLDCSNNQLTALDVSSNTALTTLDCKNNQLTALDVSSNTALEDLDCYNNQLTALDVSKNTKLTSLSCSTNQLTKLDVSENTELTELRCSNNQLTALDVSSNTALTKLYCSTNQLTALDVSSNTALYKLACAANQLTMLDVSKNTELTELGCSTNQLTALDVSSNTALTTLLCSFNQLTALDVSKNTELAYLDCFTNQLTALDVSKNTELDILNCSSNQLTALDVSKNTALIALDCSNNYMADKSAVKGLDESRTTDFTFTPQKTSTSTYSITVNSGTANPSTAAEGANITITADTAPSGKRFNEWTVGSGGATLANAKASSTTFKMPTNAVEVTATYEDIPAGVTPVTGITLNKTALSLYSNKSTKTANLTATITPADATDKSVTWQSSNTSVATVDENGLVTAVGNGTAKITVTTTDGGHTTSCNVTVSTYTSGGGSSGGSSSGGGSPANKATIKDNQPNQPVTAVASVTATAGTNGTASAAISDKAVTDAISKAQAEASKQEKTKDGISIGLNVTMPKGATTLKATLSQSALNGLVSASVSSLEINGSPVAISFDQKALKEIQKQANGNINITITPQSELSETARAIIGTRPVYNITVSYGNNSTVSSFGQGGATVAIPYTPASGEVISGLYAVYIDENGNATRVEGSTYDAKSGSILFTTPHFSLYGVGYTAPSAEFVDISNHWAKESIDYVVGKGMIDGTTETTFAPDTFMTRETLVTALGRLTGEDVSSYTTSSFTDVKVGGTSQPYIEWAYEKGIIHGIGENQFAPERAITREEIAVIIANFTKATGYTLPAEGKATAYADASSIGNYYKTAVTAMQQAGIMTGGTNNKFNPKSNATRGEVSSMLHRYIKLTITSDITAKA